MAWVVWRRARLAALAAGCYPSIDRIGPDPAGSDHRPMDLLPPTLTSYFTSCLTSCATSCLASYGTSYLLFDLLRDLLSDLLSPV